MIPMRFYAAFVAIPVMATCFVLVGCKKDEEKKTSSTTTTTTTGTPPLTPNIHGVDKGSTGEKTALESSGVATIKGKVTYDGEPPAPQNLAPAMEAQADKNHCLMGPKLDQTWIVGKDKGVQNAVVFLRAPAGKYFAVPANVAKRDDTVVMDQPFCAFEPHVVVINPSIYDPATKKQKATGQVFEILNSAPINHNTAWSGDRAVNSGSNQSLPKKTDGKPGKMVIDAVVPKSGEDVLEIHCDIHKWMSARAVVLDHPYYAITNANGEYEIKNAPAGAELIVACWHQGIADKLKDAPTVTTTLKAGENTENFKIKAK